MESPFPSSRRLTGGFTLVEMLLGTFILLILVIILASMSNQVTRVWRSAGSQADAFQASRSAMDSMASQLELATMNVYWDYDNPASPSRYLRKADEAFVCGAATNLITAAPTASAGPNAVVLPGQAFFFQAPMGRTSSNLVDNLQLLLNTCGFYIQYRNVNTNTVLPGGGTPPARNRYCLMQVQSAAEDMRIYATKTGANLTWPSPANNGWFNTNTLLGGTNSRMVAENIVLLLVRPMTTGTNGLRTNLTSGTYALDTRSGETNNPQAATANQLPPFVDLTLVGVAENTMLRKNITNGYQFTASDLSGLFANPDRFDDDMNAFKNVLQRERIDYRIFQQTVVLPNSKWSN